MSLGAPLRQLRGIARELRLNEVGKVQGTQAMNYILNQFRTNQTTQETYCKHQQEMEFLSDTYRTYLESQRKWRDVNETYHAKGERTVEQTAKMVGFNLPHEPKVERKPRPQE
eukprot:TRINITY_DN6631_c0_g1_i1.p1 TRINITY_DN6631_c0_g1~~TRINITY_DN6631_c0_g1_i1.p1  ORF type:complete len:113 (-),score=1.62 TRINITY_DN6631_c0_g1_i1:174-512(-)